MNKPKCTNCKKHKGTQVWVGWGGVMGWAHGNYQMWCKVCVLNERIKHINEMNKELPKLKRELSKIKCI